MSIVSAFESISVTYIPIEYNQLLCPNGEPGYTLKENTHGYSFPNRVRKTDFPDYKGPDLWLGEFL